MMNYHNITKDDMLNGDGLRVVLWLAGCEHHCKGCQNPITWNPNDGELFTEENMQEIETELQKPYISGITFSGGDPLHLNNYAGVKEMCKYIKEKYPSKTIWLYTGYTWEQLTHNKNLGTMLRYIDVLVDGRFVESLLDKNAKWVGSTNQRIIDVQESIKSGKVILHESN